MHTYYETLEYYETLTPATPEPILRIMKIPGRRNQLSRYEAGTQQKTTHQTGETTIKNKAGVGHDHDRTERAVGDVPRPEQGLRRPWAHVRVCGAVHEPHIRVGVGGAGWRPRRGDARLRARGGVRLAVRARGTLESVCMKWYSPSST